MPRRRSPAASTAAAAARVAPLHRVHVLLAPPRSPWGGAGRLIRLRLRGTALARLGARARVVSRAAPPTAPPPTPGSRPRRRSGGSWSPPAPTRRPRATTRSAPASWGARGSRSASRAVRARCFASGRGASLWRSL